MTLNKKLLAVIAGTTLAGLSFATGIHNKSNQEVKISVQEKKIMKKGGEFKLEYNITIPAGASVKEANIDQLRQTLERIKKDGNLTVTVTIPGKPDIKTLEQLMKKVESKDGFIIS